MAYTKQEWRDGESGSTPITATRLGHIEDGIDSAASTADSAASSIASHTSASDPHPQYVEPADLAGLVPYTIQVQAGTGLTGGGTLETDVSLSADPEFIRDTIASTLVAGTDIGVIVDDAGNTITITNTAGAVGGGDTLYVVDVTGADATGATACDAAVSTACSTVAGLVSSSTGAAGATVTLRFPPGKFKFVTDSAFNAICKAPTTQYRGVVIEGPGRHGKRSCLLSFESTASGTYDQTKNNLITVFAQRQFTVRNIGFNSTNANLSLFYLWCSAGNDGLYPEFGSTGSNTGNNSMRYENIYASGTWKRIWGADGDTRANQNSECVFTQWTTSNSLSVTDYMFRFGFPLRSAVFIATNSSAPTSGSWTFTFNGQTTSSIAYNASAATVQAAIGGLSSVGSGNCTVSGTSSAGYIVKFTNSLLGADTTLASVTSSVSPVSFKCYRYTPQMSQFLNYHFYDNEFEYGNGNFMLLNFGGFVMFDGYNSLINAINNSSYSGTWFTMENLPSRADDMAHLSVRDARFELRTPTSKVIDSWWGDVNKFITFENVGIATPTSASFSIAQRDALEVMAFRSANTSLCQVSLSMIDLPGYITVQTTGPATAGGFLTIKQARFKSSTSASAVKYADQSALASASGVGVRVLGASTGTVDYAQVVGAAGYRATNGAQTL